MTNHLRETKYLFIAMYPLRSKLIIDDNKFINHFVSDQASGLGCLGLFVVARGQNGNANGAVALIFDAVFTTEHSHWLSNSTIIRV